MSDFANKVKDAATDAKNAAKDAAHDAGNAVKDAAHDARNAAQDAASDAKSNANVENTNEEEPRRSRISCGAPLRFTMIYVTHFQNQQRGFK